MKILTVDDSLVMRRMIGNTASVLGYETLEARNGRDALDLMETSSREIALILLDQNMPEMPGLEFLEKVKAEPTWNHIPVMMVTSDADTATVVRALKAGASNYLTKPFAQEDLSTKILQCLGQG